MYIWTLLQETQRELRVLSCSTIAAKLLLVFPQKLLSKVHVNFLQFVIQPFSYFQICSSFSFN